MNWLNKLEQKIGHKAIPNITRVFIIANILGTIIYYGSGNVALYYLQFSPSLILKGQVWRLITWVLMPTGSISIWSILFIFCLWMLGTSLENYLGAFRMNVYFLGGVILNDIVGMVVYLITKVPLSLSIYYMLISMYLMLGLLMPNAEVRLYFVLPIKMKWLVIIYFIMFGMDIYNYFSYGVAVGISYGIPIVLALINLGVFVYSCKHRLSFKQNVKQKARQQHYKAQFSEPRPGSGITHHKCCICGRTEVTNPELTFRYCSKCQGNREYCSDHLFTHEHYQG